MPRIFFWPSRPMLIYIALVLGTIFLLILVAVATASPACMTKAEARAKFPKAWIYWHGINHCWDDQRPGHRVARPTERTALAGVQWHPRIFNAVAAIAPPVLVSVVAHRWPGAHLMDASVTVIEPITIVVEADFNELDERAGQ